jgi:hypothetical protein
MQTLQAYAWALAGAARVRSLPTLRAVLELLGDGLTADHIALGLEGAALGCDAVDGGAGAALAGAADEDVAVERALVAASPVPVEDLVKELDLALILAAWKGRAAFAHYVVDLGAPVDGEMLAYSAFSGSEELVDLLVRRGASVTVNTFCGVCHGLLAMDGIDWRAKPLAVLENQRPPAVPSELPALRRVLATMSIGARWDPYKDKAQDLVGSIMLVSEEVVAPVSGLEAFFAVHGRALSDTRRRAAVVDKVYEKAMYFGKWPVVHWALERLGPPTNTGRVLYSIASPSSMFEDDPCVACYRAIAGTGSPAAIARLRRERAGFPKLLMHGLLRGIYHPSMEEAGTEDRDGGAVKASDVVATAPVEPEAAPQAARAARDGRDSSTRSDVQGRSAMRRAGPEALEPLAEGGAPSSGIGDGATSAAGPEEVTRRGAEEGATQRRFRFGLRGGGIGFGTGTRSLAAQPAPSPPPGSSAAGGAVAAGEMGGEERII